MIGFYENYSKYQKYQMEIWKTKILMGHKLIKGHKYVIYIKKI